MKRCLKKFEDKKIFKPEKLAFSFDYFYFTDFKKYDKIVSEALFLCWFRKNNKTSVKQQ